MVIFSGPTLPNVHCLTMLCQSEQTKQKEIQKYSNLARMWQFILLMTYFQRLEAV